MTYKKYPRTWHLPWSPGIHDDDKALKDCSQFEGKQVIVTMKMDGENTTMYDDHIHARSIDSRGGEDRAWVKQFWGSICRDIPEGWRVCGENLWAEHSIHYKDLPSYFLGFSIWNDQNVCLDWDQTLEYFGVLNIKHVPVLYTGIWDEKIIRDLEKKMDFVHNEGYVVRLADSFSYGQFKNSIAKFVRRGHVQTEKHWRHAQAFTPNELSK